MILNGAQFNETYALKRLENSPLGLLISSENKDQTPNPDIDHNQENANN